MAVTKIYKGNIVRDDIVKIYKGNELIYEAVPQGETWVINESPGLYENVTYNISFMSNNESYDLFITESVGVLQIYYNTTLVYGFNSMLESFRWIDQVYRTVTFETAPTGDLLTWLQANAVKQ